MKGEIEGDLRIECKRRDALKCKGEDWGVTSKYSGENHVVHPEDGRVPIR